MPTKKPNSDEYHKNHPLQLSIEASSYVQWIYMAKFWHTLKEGGSKYRLKFMLDRKELSLTLDDFRTIFHLPQETNNNHVIFVPPPLFYDIIPLYNNHLGFTMELKTPSSFKTTGLLQTWQTLCKIFSKCLTMHVTGWDQPPLQIMQMLYCFINNIHIIIGHYMTNFPKISRHARYKYHNLKDDDLMKSIFNSGRYKDKVGMKIPDWMISEEMKQTEHYQMYAEVFGIDVPLIQSLPTDTTHGTHRTPSAPRNHEHNIPGTRLEPRSDKESPEMGITDVIVHVNVYDEEEEEDEITDEELHGRHGYLFEHLRAKFMPRKSFVTLFDHLHEAMADSLPTMVDKHIKEKVEKQVPEQVGNQVPVYVAEGLILERQKTKEEIEKMIAKSILQKRKNIHAQISSQIQQAIANDIPSQVDASVRIYLSRHILHVHPAQPQITSVPEQQYQLYLLMKDDPQWQQQDIAIWLALQIKFERLQFP
nr:hypothetical protein [Tanacetum cinerariifolium]